MQCITFSLILWRILSYVGLQKAAHWTGKDKAGKKQTAERK